MRRITPLGIGLLMSCAGQEESVTLDDAVALDFMQITCAEAISVETYAGGDPVVSEDEYCAEVLKGIGAAEASGLTDPNSLVADSLSVIVVESVRFAPVPALPDHPSLGFIVYFDFVNRSQNLHVAMPGVEGLTDVTWAQEGLRF